MIRVPFVELAAEHAELGGDLRVAFDRVLESGTFILGSGLEARSSAEVRHTSVLNSAC